MKAILYDMLGLNRALFEALHAGVPAALRPLAQAVSWTAEPRLAPLVLTTLALALGELARGALRAQAISFAWRFGLSTVLSLAVAWGVKLALDFPRPWSMPGLVMPETAGFPPGASFPSGHAVVAAVVVTSLWGHARSRWMRAALMTWALAVIASRVVLGAHFPADVLWGGIIGVAATVTASAALGSRAGGTGTAHALLLAIAAFVADVLAKTLIVSSVPLRASIEVLPVLNIVHWLNQGAAFSFLHDAGGWQRWLLLAIGLSASAWLTWAIARGRYSRVKKMAFGAILGGAAANVFDRLLRGAVVDWIDLHWSGWHWPAFNLADTSISIGVAVLLVAAWRPANAGKPATDTTTCPG